MSRPERYQLAFEFVQPAAPATTEYTLAPGSLARLDHREIGGSRFVRTLREQIVIRSPAEAARHLLTRIYTPFEQFDQEELWALLLNGRNRVTHETMVYRGTVNSIYVRPAELFKEAVRHNSHALLLSHCHPGGEPTPSPEDVHTTALAVEAGKLLGIELLDHIICGNGVWFSLKEHGLGFKE